jgi:hypothetical protein
MFYFATRLPQLFPDGGYRSTAWCRKSAAETICPAAEVVHEPQNRRTVPRFAYLTYSTVILRSELVSLPVFVAEDDAPSVMCDLRKRLTRHARHLRRAMFS